MAKKGKKGATTLTSYSKILNIGYGVLNPIRDTLTGKNFDPQDILPVDLVRNAFQSFYSPNNFLGTGPYVGIVLRDDGNISEGIADLANWTSGPFAYNVTDEEEGGVSKERVIHLPPLVQLRVRIPEIHAALAIPKYLPTRKQTGKDPKTGHDFNQDHIVINQYPVFVAQNARISKQKVAPGDLVWVDFQNRNTLEGGIFIGPVNEKPGTPTSGGSVAVGGAVHLFSRQKCEQVPTTPGCEIIFPTGVEYDDSNLVLSPGKPSITGAVPEKFDFTDIEVPDPSGAGTGKEGTNYEDLGGSPKYKTERLKKLGVYEKVPGTNHRQTRIKYFAYGTPDDGMIVKPAEFRGWESYKGVHKLIEPRLKALNELWGHFYRAFLAEQFGNVKAENFKYVDSRDNKLKPYHEKYLLSRTIVPATDPFVKITPYKLKDYLINKIDIKKKRGAEEFQLSFSKIAYPGTSPHATGLAFDITNNGLCPENASATGYDLPKSKIPQYCSIGYMFWMKYGWLFGFSNYNKEPWHWELKVPRNCWAHSLDYCHDKVGTKKHRRTQGWGLLGENQAKAENAKFIIFADGNREPLPDTYVQITDFLDSATTSSPKYNKYLEIQQAVDALSASSPIEGLSPENAKEAAYQRVLENRVAGAIDKAASITAWDLVNNPSIIADEGMRTIYKNELKIVYKGKDLRKIKFPFAVFVEETENKAAKHSKKKEISEIGGTSTDLFSSFLKAANVDNGLITKASDISWGPGPEKPNNYETLRQKLVAIEIDPTKRYFTLPYFNTRGKITDLSVRQKDTEATK
jgi:hypothetical protein